MIRRFTKRCEAPLSLDAFCNEKSPATKKPFRWRVMITRSKRVLDASCSRTHLRGLPPQSGQAGIVAALSRRRRQGGRRSAPAVAGARRICLPLARVRAALDEEKGAVTRLPRVRCKRRLFLRPGVYSAKCFRKN